MKQKASIAIIAFGVLLVWFLMGTDDGRALASDFVYWIRSSADI